MSAPFPLLRRSLGDSWRSLIGWSAGIAAALFLYLPLFPSLGGAGSQMAKLINTLPPQLIKALGYAQITTGGGYTESTFYGLIGFVLIVIAATAWGSAAIAGDEESGGLELTLAHAVSRTRVAVERGLSVLLRLAWLALLSGLLVGALNGPSALGLGLPGIVAVSAAYLGLGTLSATTALAVGASTGRRVYATGAGAGIAILGYVLNAIGNQQKSLEVLRAWSPYGWAYRHTPLVHGADWAGLALLYGTSAVLAVVTVIALRRRDIAG
ncbi:ABC transporter permease subunit [Galbitalea soli]|uniref:ABC transporter permease subunit n=1 Tax=Galbitalea soli TaxID=1268042 RepID=A0A7C9TTA5_9MICO|nr:ABC transporter permease subunit [Galbitalea soli]NEM92202.1 ABC transporter permease subunit [Galbitalea soli]NYJ31844.1 ABC-2 type transport system permease protein [Galbitalea soli]